MLTKIAKGHFGFIFVKLNNKNMKKILFLTSVLVVWQLSLTAQNFYEFKELPYSYSALEPYIDSTTMETHYAKHHKGYYNNFVKAMQEGNFDNKPLEQVIQNISSYSVFIRNNGGGYWNHEFFWNCMSPNKTQASNALTKAITDNFGSFENFKKEFSSAASTVFGSGWAWVIVTDSGKLKIVKTANQDNPLMDVVADKGTPILAIDVWEHAYYLKHKNLRAAYVENFWQVINWQFVSEKYADAVK